MALWDRYVKWTEQYYPKGGKDSHLSELLQRCVQQFNNEEKYKNDPRFLNVWMKLVSYTCILLNSTPVEWKFKGRGIHIVYYQGFS